MQQTVGTTPVLLGEGNWGGGGPSFGPARPIVQNLGPGDLYLDFSQDVSSSSGIKLEPDDPPFEVPGGRRGPERHLWAVATADTDVRFMDAG